MNSLSEKYDRVVSFASIHQAMKAEKNLQNTELEFLLVPTPRAISASCGQCMFFFADDENEILQIFKSVNVTYNKIFHRDISKDVYEEIVEKIQ